nr:hypothetical protein [Psychromonas sp. CD1]
MATEHSVDVFIKSNFPEKNLFLYKTRRNGKALYIAIYGQYSNYDAALKGAQKLPRSLSIMGSWIKTYASVHQDIQLNND